MGNTRLITGVILAAFNFIVFGLVVGISLTLVYLNQISSHQGHLIPIMLVSLWIGISTVIALVKDGRKGNDYDN